MSRSRIKSNLSNPSVADNPKSSTPPIQSAILATDLVKALGQRAKIALVAMEKEEFVLFSSLFFDILFFSFLSFVRLFVAKADSDL